MYVGRKPKVETATAPSSPVNETVFDPPEDTVEAVSSADEEISQVSEDDLAVITSEQGGSILDCGASWLTELFNFSTTGRERKKPLPDLNFLNYVELSRNQPH